MSSTAPRESRPDALDTLVELLSELDDPSERAFYDQVCRALCRLTSLERAGLYLYDDARKLVVPVGCHNLDRGLLEQTHGTLEETPIAQRALTEDRVVEASGRLEDEIPARYARFGGISTLTCTPVSAAGRWLGVVFADRDGGNFTLTRVERDTMWALGRTVALATSARLAMSRDRAARGLSGRIDLAREVHERVVQRLFGVSLVLGSEHALTSEERERCAAEMHGALVDLRDVLSRPLWPSPIDTGETLRAELARLDRHYKDLPLSLEWEDGAEVPEGMETLAQSVLAEALRNADRHARPSEVRVRVGRIDGTFFIEVRNDGMPKRRRSSPSAGMGLRLAAMEALTGGGVVEFGPEGTNEWRVRLLVPAGDDEG